MKNVCQKVSCVIKFISQKTSYFMLLISGPTCCSCKLITIVDSSLSQQKQHQASRESQRILEFET